MNSAKENIATFAFLLGNDTLRIINMENHLPPRKTCVCSGTLGFQNTTAYLHKKILRALEKVSMCYFNPSETNHTELVKNHHCKEVKEKKWISEEPRNSPSTVAGKGILRKQLAYSFLFTKLLRGFSTT